MAAAALFAAACTKTPDTPVDPPYVPSTACKVTFAKVTSGVSSRECTVFEKEKSIDVLRLEGYDLSELYFEIKVSDKAFIDLDLSKPIDCSDTNKVVKLTVTAEDSTTKAVYTFDVRTPELAFACTPVKEMTTGALGITHSFTTGADGCPVNGGTAFCDTKHFVSVQGMVYDFNGTKVGDINMEGVCATRLNSVTNDDNGVLVASAIGTKTLKNDAGDMVDVTFTAFYAWVDGYDKKPVVIYTNEPAEWSAENCGGNAGNYISCGGDVNADFILTAITNGRGATTMHHVFEYHNGDFESPVWHAFTTEYPSADGNWGQMISPTSGNIDGWFVIGDSMGDNKGYHVYTRQGVTDQFEDNVLKGTTWPDGLVPDGVPEGNNWYGNYSTGHVYGFQFLGLDYVVCTTTGWPCTYVTVQSMVPEYDEDGFVANYDTHYLLPTQQLNGSQVTPSSSYVYNSEDEKGYIITITGADVILWEVAGEII